MRNVLRIPSQSSSACWTGGAGASSRSRGNGVPGSGFSHGFWLILTSFPCVLIFLMTSEFLRLPLCAILLCLPLFCRAGGEPLINDKSLLGAIGVSGTKGKEDELITSAGIDTFNEIFKRRGATKNFNARGR